MRAIPRAPDAKLPAYVCERGHRTPYDGGAVVIYCPARIGLRMTCGALARVQKASIA